jgi:hypothetical protein
VAQLSAVQFHLITTTILLLSREGFRRGCLRIQEQDMHKAARKQVTHSTVMSAKMWMTKLTGLLSASLLYWTDWADLT